MAVHSSPADRVHAAMKHMEPSALQAVLDGAAADAGLAELSPGHHAVLAVGELRNPSIQSTKTPLTIYIGVKAVCVAAGRLTQLTKTSFAPYFGVKAIRVDHARQIRGGRRA